MPDRAIDRKEVGTEGEADPQPRVDIPWSGSRGRIDGSRLAPSIRRNDCGTRRIAVYILSRQRLHPTLQVRYGPVGLFEDMRSYRLGPAHKGPRWCHLSPAKQVWHFNSHQMLNCSIVLGNQFDPIVSRAAIGDFRPVGHGRPKSNRLCARTPQYRIGVQHSYNVFANSL